MSQQQAEAVMAQYLEDALKSMPGQPTSRRTLHSIDKCDDPADRVPAGSQNIADFYALTFTTPPDNTQLFDTLHDHWVSKGYRITTDQRDKPSNRTLVAENPHDGYAMTLVESNAATLSLDISSPCLNLTS